jgi:transposase
MRQDVHMPRRKRRKFTAEEKADAVRLVREVGNLAQVARDLDLTETALRNWVQQADIDQGKGPDGALTSAELQELRRLRRQVRILEMERDFAKKAAAFFAKDLDPPSS